jgi:hypothetical protein
MRLEAGMKTVTAPTAADSMRLQEVTVDLMVVILPKVFSVAFGRPQRIQLVDPGHGTFTMVGLPVAINKI